MNHLEGLNLAQREAVLHTGGPLLIVAGAGAGKTKTITHRILHLILEKGVRPEQILAVTFTNKAAKEMRDRASALLFGETDAKKRNVWLGKSGIPFIATFHSLGVFILRENAEKIGLPRHFTILDAGDSFSAIKQALKAEGFDPKVLDPKLVRGTISKNKGDMVSIADYESNSERSANKQHILRVWRRYEKMLKEQNALDFDDLLLKTVRLLANDTSVREKYQNFFRYIHIDEYQDTNKIQYELSGLLLGADRNICVVGDADQNIYSWRGADISNILNFEKDYPGAKVVLLEENYRSTDIILQVANAVIARNTERIEKNLFTSKKEGEKIGLIACYNEYEEAEQIARKIEELRTSGMNFADMAILYRANFQSRVLEEILLSRGIPYHVLGVKFFERKEVKDVLSYLRAALNPESTADVSRAVNAPSRGIGKVTLEKIFRGEQEKMTAPVRKKVKTFFDFLENIREAIEKSSASEVILKIIKESGIEGHLKGKKEEGAERLENLYELAALAGKYDGFERGESELSGDADSPVGEAGILKLLEDAALMSDQDTMPDAGGTDASEKMGVRLMTVHAAKGLEFPYVFITGLEQDLFPHKRFDEERNSKSLEEERRLFYVAITRAEKKLFLSYTSVRTKFGSKTINTPSEFLDDLKDEWIEAESALMNPSPIKTIFFDDFD